ncbi:hypothetical protein [Lysobacter sp. Root494]|uniref:hypothetical protein n=1 Tax=Lysobacter sp. Root494 TaxID=1736549 RepID=UPI0012F990D3|nr:hypothetical protein [Lysobacter sp. Root494]
MTKSFLTVAICLGALVGCTQSTDPALQKAQADLIAACPFSIHEVFVTGNPAKRSFIGPEHVASITAAPENYPGEQRAILVTLTAKGEQKMLRFSQEAIGESVAFFCGETEMSRATILAPPPTTLGSSSLSRMAPNNSFKPKPLRGSA